VPTAEAAIEAALAAGAAAAALLSAPRNKTSSSAPVPLPPGPRHGPFSTRLFGGWPRRAEARIGLGGADPASRHGPFSTAPRRFFFFGGWPRRAEAEARLGLGGADPACWHGLFSTAPRRLFGGWPRRAELGLRGTDPAWFFLCSTSLAAAALYYACARGAETNSAALVMGGNVASAALYSFQLATAAAALAAGDSAGFAASGYGTDPQIDDGGADGRSGGSGDGGGAKEAAPQRHDALLFSVLSFGALGAASLLQSIGALWSLETGGYFKLCALAQLALPGALLLLHLGRALTTCVSSVLARRL